MSSSALEVKGFFASVDGVDAEMSIGAVAERSGVATSALRFYEDRGLIHSHRNSSGHRRYRRSVLRRVAFIRFAQQMGLTLGEIRGLVDELPDNRVPDAEDWARVSAAWTPLLDAHIEQLQRLRDRLTGCIGCGCLSMKRCGVLNPGDELAEQGPGPRLVIDG
jgi:MerR family redox-sensitive transcriptional activator SoxR